MKIGLLASTLAAARGYEPTIAWAASQGFEALSFTTSTPARVSTIDVTSVLSDATSRRGYVEPLARHGLRIENLFCYGVNVLHPNPDERRRNQEWHRDVIRAAAELGAPVVISGIGNPIERAEPGTVNPWGIYYYGVARQPGARRRDEALAFAAEVWRPILEFAAAHDVKVSFEPSVFGGGIAHSPETFDIFFDLVGHPAVGVNFDPSHMLWQGVDVIAYAEQLLRQGRLFSAHGKDAEIIWERVRYAGFLSDGWWRHRLPGWGELDWVAVFQRLRAGEFSGTMDVEHEDELFGYRFDDQHQLINVDEYQRGLVLSVGYLKHCRDIAIQSTR